MFAPPISPSTADAPRNELAPGPAFNGQAMDNGKRNVAMITVVVMLALAAFGFVAFKVGGGHSTRTVTKVVNVPGPTVTKTVTVDVPGPTVHELPSGCGDAVVAYETAVNHLLDVEDQAWGNASTNSLSQFDVDAVSAAKGVVSSADATAATLCFSTS